MPDMSTRPSFSLQTIPGESTGHVTSGKNPFPVFIATARLFGSSDQCRTASGKPSPLTSRSRTRTLSTNSIELVSTGLPLELTMKLAGYLGGGGPKTPWTATFPEPSCSPAYRPDCGSPSGGSTSWYGPNIPRLFNLYFSPGGPDPSS